MELHPSAAAAPPPPMAIVTTTAAPSSPALPSSDDPYPPSTKMCFPRKKPLRWPTGVAPGECGLPPATIKLRRNWGSRGDEDLVASTDDSIWNKDLLDRMQSLLRKTRPPQLLSSHKIEQKEQSLGFLSLNRAMSLDRSYQSICRGKCNVEIIH